jgi:Ca2+-binding RTX toxin-like protein
VNGGEGSDIFFVGSGNDTVNGNGGDDDLYGESGSDTLNGGDGNDELFGGSGTDTMNGGAGNDDLDGGSGNDRMSGGSGDDDFIFQSGNGYDTVTDFQVGSDQILVDGITIRSVTYKNVGGGAALDTIVTFGSGGGSVTLLDTGNLGDNGQARITAENGNPNSTPSSAPPASFATSQSLAGPSGLAFTDLVL